MNFSTVVHRSLFCIILAYLTGCQLSYRKYILSNFEFVEDFSDDETIGDGGYDRTINSKRTFLVEEIHNCRENIQLATENWAQKNGLRIRRIDATESSLVIHIRDFDGNRIIEVTYHVNSRIKRARVSVMLIDARGTVIDPAAESNTEYIQHLNAAVIAAAECSS